MESAFDGTALDEVGRKAGFLKRARKITPARLIPCLVAALGASKVTSVADLARTFGQMTGQMLDERSFLGRLDTPSFPVLMKTVFLATAEKLAFEALRFLPGSPFNRFGRVLIQDGSSFALDDGLAEIFPGRFRKNSPAAVELHATLDLLTGQPHAVELSPDTTSERDFLPAPETLTGLLLLADRGYPKFEYLAAVDRANGAFIMRSKANFTTPVLGVYQDGQLVDLEHPVPLVEYLAAHPKGPLDLVLQVVRGGQAHHFRFLALPTTKDRTYLITNLPRHTFSPEVVGLAYRLRWQVELMFREWKSHANLHRFATEKAPIAEGLIWASLLAALLTRFLAHAAQMVNKVTISTLKAAKMMNLCLPRLMQIVLDSSVTLISALKDVLDDLARFGKRAHPKRDQNHGREVLGLGPRFLNH